MIALHRALPSSLLYQPNLAGSGQQTPWQPWPIDDAAVVAVDRLFHLPCFFTPPQCFF